MACSSLLSVCCALLLSASCVRAAPAPPTSTTTTSAPPAVGAGPTDVPPLPPLQSGEDFYDQRQNGSENYRIHMDGMVVVVAPPEALLSISGAGQGAGQGGLLEQQLLDIVAAQQQAGVEETNDVRPGKPGGSSGKPPSGPQTPCLEGTPGCKKRRPLPAKSRSQLRLASLLLPLLRRSN